MCGGEYHRQLSFQDIHAMSFARDSDGGPAGSPEFASNASRHPDSNRLRVFLMWSVFCRLHVVKRAQGFPRPMLSMEAEESRSRWTGESGTTVSESDRWKVGVASLSNIEYEWVRCWCEVCGVAGRRV